MMLSNILIAPSLNSLFFTGILLLIIFFLIIKHFKQLINMNFYNKTVMLSTLVIAIGVHGLIHLGVEQYYGFNPYKWI
jgi:hypothetical protein